MFRHYRPTIYSCFYYILITWAQSTPLHPSVAGFSFFIHMNKQKILFKCNTGTNVVYVQAEAERIHLCPEAILRTSKAWKQPIMPGTWRKEECSHTFSLRWRLLEKLEDKTHLLLRHHRQNSWSPPLGVAVLGTDICSRGLRGSCIRLAASAQAKIKKCLKPRAFNPFFFSTCPSNLRALADTRGLQLSTQVSFTR